MSHRRGGMRAVDPAPSYWHTTTAGSGQNTGTGYRAGVSTMPRAPSSDRRTGMDADARLWHTTTAGSGVETGTGFRPGVSSMPRASSPDRSHFHPERIIREAPPVRGHTRRQLHPAAKPTFPESSANLGDANLYVHEREGTALWSSVLEGMPHEEKPIPTNSNYLGPARGDPKKYVDERLQTIISSSSLDRAAAALISPAPSVLSRPASNISGASKAPRAAPPPASRHKV